MSPLQGEPCGQCPLLPQALEGAATVLAVPGPPGERGQGGTPGRVVSVPLCSQHLFEGMLWPDPFLHSPRADPVTLARRDRR